MSISITLYQTVNITSKSSEGEGRPIMLNTEAKRYFFGTKTSNVRINKRKFISVISKITRIGKDQKYS